MGLLYKIYQSMQEQVKDTTELMDREKDEDKSSEYPNSLIELLSQPIGKKERVKSSQGSGGRGQKGDEVDKEET